MKHVVTRITAGLLFCGILVMGFMGVQAQEAGQPPVVYALVDFMKVPDGKDDLYQNVERLWERLHRVRCQEGIIKDWFLMKTQRQSGPPADYNYATVHLYDCWDKIETINFNDAWAKVQDSFTDEDKSVMEKAGEARDLVHTELWRLEDSALPWKWAPDGTVKQVPRKYTLGFMKSKNGERHIELEKSFWKKIWIQSVEDGLQSNWLLWECRFPGGSLRPYDWIAVHAHTDPDKGTNLSQDWFKAKQAKIFPDKNEKEIATILEETAAVRDIPIQEEWTVIRTTADPGKAE